jgi:hypothetical protein
MKLLKWLEILGQHMNIFYIRICMSNISMDKELGKIDKSEFYRDLKLYIKELRHCQRKIKRLKKI